MLRTEALSLWRNGHLEWLERLSCYGHRVPDSNHNLVRGKFLP